MKIILLIITLTFTLYSNTLEKVSLQLKWKTQFQFAGFIAAKEKGFYKDEGIDVEMLEYTPTTDTLLDLEKGKTTFAISDSAVILEASKGKKLVALMAIYQTSPYVLISLTSSNITTLSDLDNKKVALYDDMNSNAINAMFKMNDIHIQKVLQLDTLSQLQTGEVDVSIAYISNEPYMAKEKNISINILDLKNYGFNRYGDILFTLENTVKNRPELVEKMYRATKKGFHYAFENIDEMVDIIYDKYNTQKKSKESYYYEANRLKELIGDNENFGRLDSAKVDSIGYVYSYMNSLKYNKDNLKNFIYKYEGKEEFNLTDEELAYLKKKKSISMCYATTHPPYTMMEHGQPVGVSVNFLRLIEKKIKIPFEFIYADTLREEFKMAKNKVCDSVPVILTSPQIIPFLVATKPAGKDTLSMVTKIDEPYIFDMKTLKNKKIGINKYSVNIIEFIKLNYPEIDYIMTEAADLEKIIDDEIYGFIGPSVKMNYLVSIKYKNKLKVMRTLEHSTIEGSIGVHVDEPILLSILNKAITSVGQLKKEQIYNKWINIKYKEVVDYTLLYQSILIAIFIVAIIFYWNIRLRREIKKRKKIEYEKSCILKDLQQITNDSIEFIADLPIGIISSDPLGKEGSHCNKIFLKMFGWDLKDIDTIDKWFNNAYPDAKYRAEVIRVWEEKVNEAKRQNRPYSTPMEVKVTCKDGNTKWCQVRYYKRKQFIVSGIFVDISERKKIENQLFELNSSLEEKVKFEIRKNKKHQLIMMEQTKLAQMGEMIGNIAHQWRQPLAQVNSSILIIDTVLKKNSLQNDLIDLKLLEIEELTQYMSNTIDNFQNFFNQDKEKTLFNLRETIIKSIDIIQGTLSSNFTKIEINIDELFESKGYPLELQQVLVVILSNANDALKLREVKKPKIIIDIEYLVDTYIISISDNAGGVKTKKLEQIFEPYYTTKHQSQGKGIGLYMAKMIIEEGMKGKLTLENKKNGACFKINILKELNNE